MVADFRRAFDGPATFWDAEREERIATEPRRVGSLDLPSGRIAIHDPGYEFAPDPLDREVPPGRYPVDLALRSWRNEGGSVSPPGLIAAVRVVLGPGRAERFVPVRSALRGGELDIGVDSGLVAIFDRALLPALAGRAILDAMPETAAGTPVGTTEAAIWPASVGSAFVGTAGMGDGAYRAWWGEDAAGKAVELIVDFGLLEHSLWRTVEVPAAALLGSAARLRLALLGSDLELEAVPFESTGVPELWIPAARAVAIRRAPGLRLEFSLRDTAGAWVAGPAKVELVPGPWFEIFDREQVQRASVLRVRIHEGNAPHEPLDP